MAPALQLVALAGVEVVEGQVQLTVAPQRLGLGADIGRRHGELVAHGQLMVAGLDFEITFINGGLFVHFQGL